jgi:hypothetical protein
MAATGFTPIQLYHSSTAAAQPVNTNLADGELAINITDEKLYFKNAAGTVKLLAANITAVANGGTGATSLTANNVILGNGTSAVQVVAPGTTGNVLTSNGTTWSSTAPAVTLTNAVTLANKQWQAYTETVVTVGTVSASTYNIDLSLANIFDITLGNNVTFTFTNPPASGISRNVTVILRQDATGSRLATFTNANYTDGVDPVLSTGANNIDVLTFFTLNGGSFWFGTFAMANVS